MTLSAEAGSLDSSWECGCPRKDNTAFKCDGTCKIDEEWTCHWAKTQPPRPGGIVAVLSHSNAAYRSTYTFNWDDKGITGSFHSSDPNIASAFKSRIDSMSVEEIHTKLPTLIPSESERVALTTVVADLQKLQDTHNPRAFVPPNADRPKLLACLIATLFTSESRPICRSIRQHSPDKVQEILFPDGVVSRVREIGAVRWGVRDDSPFLIHDQCPCPNILSAIENSHRNHQILGLFSKLHGGGYIFSVLLSYMQTHGKDCHQGCPSFSIVCRVLWGYWPKYIKDPTSGFRRVFAALVSQFYDTEIFLGENGHRYDTILRRAEIHERSVTLYCDNENQRLRNDEPIMGIEMPCGSFSLNGIHFPPGIHDGARELLCCGNHDPVTVSHIRWKSSTDGERHPIQFRVEGTRVSIEINPSLGSPTHEREEARHYLESRLSYQRMLCSPQEFAGLLRVVRKHLLPSALPENLWALVEWVDVNPNHAIRTEIVGRSEKSGPFAFKTPRLVRHANILQALFLEPPQVSALREFHEDLTSERQKTEARLTQVVRDLYLDAQKLSELDRDLTEQETQRFQNFILYTLALFQYFLVDGKGYYSLIVQEHGVCLKFDTSSSTLTWAEWKDALRAGTVKDLLGFQFQLLPWVVGQIPVFRDLSEEICPVIVKCYRGKVVFTGDLCLLCMDYENLRTADLPAKNFTDIDPIPIADSLPEGNLVLIGRVPFEVQPSWVFQDIQHPFTVYTTIDRCGPATILIAEFQLRGEQFYFKAVIRDEKSGTTPCQDVGILPQLRQLPLFVVLHSLNGLVQELDAISPDYNRLPSIEWDHLLRTCRSARDHLARERPQNEVRSSGIESDLNVFINRWDRPWTLNDLYDLKCHTIAVRSSCTHHLAQYEVDESEDSDMVWVDKEGTVHTYTPSWMERQAVLSD